MDRYLGVLEAAQGKEKAAMSLWSGFLVSTVLGEMQAAPGLHHHHPLFHWNTAPRQKDAIWIHLRRRLSKTRKHALPT